MNRAAGPFEILEILGEGSFGTVCVARVTGDPLRRKVALKILKGAYTRNDKILNRTRDEARLLSRISHPNIVRVERLMDVGGRPVVVMEHVQGVSLDHLLLRFRDGLAASVALEITRQTCLALHVAYNETSADDGTPLRVIHRDIKPSNVLLSIHGEVKVVDFGIAKGEFEGREAQTESVVMGSRPYMAPERLDGISDSPSVDVYSAGMSLFELLTGRTMSLSINPITHDQAMNRQLGYLNVPGMTQAALEDLRGVIRKMCSYDRDFRPSALDTARDLEQMVERGEMREDFFYRINVVPIDIPPLRDRIEDIPLLVSEIMRKNTMGLDRNINRVSNKALQKLMGYHWPGNVRELGDVIERAILKTNGPVLREVDLPNSGGGLNGSGPTRFSDFELPLKEFLRRAECEYLTAVLKRNRGGISTTAEHAMIDAATLHRKMKLHALKRDDFREQPRP